MARLFTLDFYFKHKLRTALVTPRLHEYYRSFYVRFLEPDNEIERLLPEGSLLVSLSEGSSSASGQSPEAAVELLVCTRTAIQDYLKSYVEH
ncbi:hypothetical protein V9K67_06670 [Paraflavisolibacter sp. H34]|uniref:hypothetical protein n=1 Tax=Huijunlia imazamoxiresistens TaxID=3127457 RepID=UPI0030189C62